MNRREILSGTIAAGLTGTAGVTGAAGLVAGVAATLPARLSAQVRRGLPRDAILADIARREQARAGNINMLWRRDVVGIADFGLRSSENRFHFVDLERGVVNSYLVSHGDGSDPDHDGWLNWFSNVSGSHCTSKGLYATYGWYTGRYGTSIRLEGLDQTNSNALDRAIVMHRARYAERAHLERWGRLGRSNGCFAMGKADFQTALLKLGGGRILYADALGLAPDGSKVTRPHQPAGTQRLLTPDRPEGQQSINPGVS